MTDLKELTDKQFEELLALVAKMEESHSNLRKDVVHSLRGVTLDRLKEKNYKDAVTTSRRVADDWGKALKQMRKLLK